MSSRPEAPAGPAPKVFICYRREETAAHAGRLYDAMAARFGEGNVFMDVDIEPGVDFVQRITEVVSACQVLIVVMGPSWATVRDEDGDLRIADPDDFVRLEVETALRRPEVTPIPVLVGRARMPRREALPSELQAIARRNALELSDGRWSYDVGRLNTTLDRLLADVTRPDGAVTMPPASDPRTPAPPRHRPSDGRLLLEGVLVAGLTAFVARFVASEIPGGEETAAEIAGVILRRGGTWALTGAALAVWLAIRTGRADVFRLGMIGLIVGAIAGAAGGAIWSLPVLLPDPPLNISDMAQARRIEYAAAAVNGGILGAMIGALWRPPRLGVGLAGGIVAGLLFQLLIIVTGFVDEVKPGRFDVSLAFCLSAAAIAGLALTALLVFADAQREAEPPPT